MIMGSVLAAVAEEGILYSALAAADGAIDAGAGLVTSILGEAVPPTVDILLNTLGSSLEEDLIFSAADLPGVGATSTSSSVLEPLLTNVPYVAKVTVPQIVGGTTFAGIFSYVVGSNIYTLTAFNFISGLSQEKDTIPPFIYKLENVQCFDPLRRSSEQCRGLRVSSRNPRKRKMLSNDSESGDYRGRRYNVRSKSSSTPRRKVGQSSKQLRRKSNKRS